VQYNNVRHPQTAIFKLNTAGAFFWKKRVQQPSRLALPMQLTGQTPSIYLTVNELRSESTHLRLPLFTLLEEKIKSFA
jgi:hypothetical protein